MLTRGRAVGLAALLACAVIGVAAWWALFGGSLRERVEADVRAGTPVGTSRQEAADWVTQTYGALASHSSDVTGDRWVGHTVPDLAGVPAGGLSGSLRFTVRPRGMVSDVIQQVAPQQVIVYLLLDKNDQVSGYFFLSLDELRKMEIEKGR